VIGTELYSVLGWPNLHDNRSMNKINGYRGNGKIRKFAEGIAGN
jgi:hypothetical protein